MVCVVMISCAGNENYGVGIEHEDEDESRYST